MTEFPREGSIDSTLALKREPYEFISRRCERLNTDVFEARLLGRKTLCMRGRAAAEVFYDPSFFMRHGAAPEPLQKTLLGTTGVQTLDDARHRHRKAMFLALLSAPRCSLSQCLVISFAVVKRGAMSTGTSLSLSMTRCTSGRITTIRSSSVFTPA